MNGIKLELIKENVAEHENVKMAVRAYKIGAYEVEVEEYEFSNGAGHNRQIRIRKDFREEYMPDIYHYWRTFGEEIEEFKIQTTSYGTLKPDEIKKVIAGYEEALAITEILTEAFCK